MGKKAHLFMCNCLSKIVYQKVWMDKLESILKCNICIERNKCV